MPAGAGATCGAEFAPFPGTQLGKGAACFSSGLAASSSSFGGLGALSAAAVPAEPVAFPGSLAMPSYSSPPLAAADASLRPPPAAAAAASASATAAAAASALSGLPAASAASATGLSSWSSPKIDFGAAGIAAGRLGGGSAGQVCSCGNVFMPDAVYCRKCGVRRPQAAFSGDDIFARLVAPPPARTIPSVDEILRSAGVGAFTSGGSSSSTAPAAAMPAGTAAAAPPMSTVSFGGSIGGKGPIPSFAEPVAASSMGRMAPTVAAAVSGAGAGVEVGMGGGTVPAPSAAVYSGTGIAAPPALEPVSGGGGLSRLFGTCGGGGIAGVSGVGGFLGGAAAGAQTVPTHGGQPGTAAPPAWAAGLSARGAWPASPSLPSDPLRSSTFGFGGALGGAGIAASLPGADNVNLGARLRSPSPPKAAAGFPQSPPRAVAASSMESSKAVFGEPVVAAAHLPSPLRQSCGSAGGLASSFPAAGGGFGPLTGGVPGMPAAPPDGEQQRRAEVSNLRREVFALLNMNRQLHLQLTQANSQNSILEVDGRSTLDRSRSTFDERTALEERIRQLEQECQLLEEQRSRELHEASLVEVADASTAGAAGAREQRRERGDLQQQVHAARLARQSAEQRLVAAEAALGRTREEILDKQRQIVKAGSSLESGRLAQFLSKEVDGLRKDLAHAESQLGEVNAALACKNEEVRKMETDQAEIKIEYDALTQANDTLRDTIVSTRERLAAEHRGLDGAEAELSEFKAQYGIKKLDHHVEMEELKTEGAALEKEVKECRAEIRVAEVSAAASKEEIAEVSRKLEAVQEEEAALQKQESWERRDHQSEMAGIEARTQELQAEQGELAGQLSQVRAAAKEERLREELASQQLQSASEDLEFERSRSAGVFSRAQADLAEAENRVEALLQQLGQERQQNVELMRELQLAGGAAAEAAKAPWELMAPDERACGKTKGWAGNALRMHNELELLQRWKREARNVLRRLEADTSSAQQQYRRQLEENQRLQEHLERAGRQVKAAPAVSSALTQPAMALLPAREPLPAAEEKPTLPREPVALPREPVAYANGTSPAEPMAPAFRPSASIGESPGLAAAMPLGSADPMHHRWPYREPATASFALPSGSQVAPSAAPLPFPAGLPVGPDIPECPDLPPPAEPRSRHLAAYFEGGSSIASAYAPRRGVGRPAVHEDLLDMSSWFLEDASHSFDSEMAGAGARGTRPARRGARTAPRGMSAPRSSVVGGNQPLRPMSATVVRSGSLGRARRR
eukprot:TRINITY_DN10969_c0_g1_i1.p1 TRINITY_DN10969_c0_g1~~TRINITY_DN10969_c0_g1_i1.p1  ORF type:complete len:1352 (-),score=360.66 TRINITY_DN10969_c0_g1_i1:122-3898(-)